MNGQELIGRIFVEKLLQKLAGAAVSGSEFPVALIVYHPERKEQFNLEKAFVTYSPELNEIVIHEGLRTTHIFVDKGWESVQYLPSDAEKKTEPTLMFRKVDVAYELD